MVLPEKPPTGLPVMYERLKHLTINADAFREKMRVGSLSSNRGKREEK